MNLDLVVAERLIYWSQQIAVQVMDKWNGQVTAANDGNRSINANEVIITSKAVMVDIVARGMSAWVLEFGSGHQMITDFAKNPYLQDYMNSDHWNPERANDGNEFVGRAEGDTVYRLDGSSYLSTGKAEGLRLEHAIGKKGQFPPLQSSPPMETIKTEVTFTLPLIIEDVGNAVSRCVGDEISQMLEADIYI